MNTAERVIHYGNLEPEAAKTRPDDPPKSWPEHGAVMFDNVELKYRPDLPAVLKGTSFAIRAGENVGIVGRTGAGSAWPSCAHSFARTGSDRLSLPVCRVLASPGYLPYG